jgi:hypothetical protein
MRWLRFILSYSIFSSICAAALCYQTVVLLHIKTEILLFVFVFFSTLCSYNFYWLISKFSFNHPVGFAWFFKNNLSYIFILLFSGLGMIICLYFIPKIYQYVAIAIVLTLLYSMPLWPFKFSIYLRKAGIFKTILLAFTWAFVTVLIPAASVLQIEKKEVLALMVARFFFMLMLCTIFDKRDIKLDKLHALKSLATELSPNTLKTVMLCSFIIYIGAGFWVRYQFSDLNQLLAFLITGLLVGWVYLLSLKKQGYFFYYFVVDGLMLFTATATCIATLF